MRGIVTEEIKTKAISYFPNGISKQELRLIPYVCYVAQNERKVDFERINREEREILEQWEENGWIKNYHVKIEIRKDFWSFMCEMIYMAYVNYKENNEKGN